VNIFGKYHPNSYLFCVNQIKIIMTARSLLLTFLAWAVLCANGMASVVITGTRVVYPLNAKDVSVRLTNNGTFPSLVQAWIDDGDIKASPENIAVPFILSPPMFRINPTRSQILRLVYTGEGKAPRDRETVYWLNVLEIPPKPEASAGENTLQFAVRSRIKLFLRPQELSGDPASAPAQVKWRMVRDGASLKLLASNPTPFHVSLAEVVLATASGTLGKPLSGMVNPLSEQSFVFEGAYPEGQAATMVRFKYVSDYGAFIDGATDLTVVP
jgi:chaperone protein EcpD